MVEIWNDRMNYVVDFKWEEKLHYYNINKKITKQKTQTKPKEIMKSQET